MDTQNTIKPDISNDTNETNEIPFWFDNPNILFDPKHILEFFPTEHMIYEQKLNAITRTILVLTIIVFFVTKNVRVIIVSLMTGFAVFLLHYYHEKEKERAIIKKLSLETKEGFDNPAVDYLTENGVNISSNVFSEPNSSNPFNNVLNTDIDFDPNRKPAPPAFNSIVNNNILNQAKQLVVDANPDQPDIADKLFKDLGDQFVFEQSLRPFNSNAVTTVPNDQDAFAEFCYGSMISCKEGNKFACARNLSRHTNY